MSRKVSSSAPSRVVALRHLDRIAGVAQADEVDALDDAAVLDVEAGDDALGQHGRSSASQRSRARGSALTAASAQRVRELHRAGVQRAADDDAASTPDGSHGSSASMSASEPTPPEAITGMSIASASARVAATLTPCCVPSRSMSV